MPELDWQDVRVFLEVARHGSFSKAAGALGMVQSTVSKRMAGLEETLGFPLYRRTRDGVRLTDEATALVEKGGALVEAIAAFSQVADSLAGKRRVTVRAPEALATWGVEPVLRQSPLPAFEDILEKLPADLFADMELLSPDDPSLPTLDLKLTAPLQGKERPNFSAPADCTTARWCQIRFIPCYSSGYAARYGAPPTWTDLTQHRLCTHARYEAFEHPKAFGPWLDMVRRARPVAARVDSSERLELLAAQGAAVALLPAIVMANHPTFRPVPDAPPMALDIHAVQMMDTQKNPRQRRAIDMLKAVLRDLFSTRREMPPA